MHNSTQRFDIADFHSPTDKAKPGAKIQKKKGGGGGGGSHLAKN